jgi:hypothetical protein
MSTHEKHASRKKSICKTKSWSLLFPERAATCTSWSERGDCHAPALQSVPADVCTFSLRASSTYLVASPGLAVPKKSCSRLGNLLSNKLLNNKVYKKRAGVTSSSRLVLARNVQFSHTSECRSLTVKFSRSGGIARDGEFFLADIATNIWDSVYCACSVVLRPRSRSPVVFAVARRSGWAAVGGRRRSGQAGSARQRAAGLCNRFYQTTPRGGSNFPLY